MNLEELMNRKLKDEQPKAVQETVGPELTEEQQTLYEGALEVCEELKMQLQEEAPELGSLMRQISEQMRQFPELVHLLSDEEIASVYQARLSQTKTHISVAKSKSRKSKGLLPTGESLGDVL